MKTVWIVGRRGPLQVAFTIKVLGPEGGPGPNRWFALGRCGRTEPPGTAAAWSGRGGSQAGPRGLVPSVVGGGGVSHLGWALGWA